MFSPPQAVQKLADLMLMARQQRVACAWVHRTLAYEQQPTDAQTAAFPNWFDVDARLTLAAEPWGKLQQVVGDLHASEQVGGGLLKARIN